jgi:beta-phosphoglucomutase-like phosphatase (HAD superfamily)
VITVVADGKRHADRQARGMQSELIDLETLVGGWRGAFDSALAALRAAGADLTERELRERSQRLSDERSATVQMLETFARDRQERRQLVRLVASTWQTKQLLGLPSDAAACVFNLDGVLIGSAAIHAEAWKETFAEFLSARLERGGEPLAAFDSNGDYLTHIHGRPRLEGVRGFLASRGISLPEGWADDPPGTATVHGLANRKTQALLRRLDEHGVTAFEGARLYLELAHDAGVRCAVVSASANTDTMLRRAHLSSLVDDRVDGTTMTAEGLHGKHDTLLAACRHLGASPEHAAVFETTADGIAAGRAGGFELVVGVASGDAAQALQAGGADLVVSELGEILEHALAA